MKKKKPNPIGLGMDTLTSLWMNTVVPSRRLIKLLPFASIGTEITHPIDYEVATKKLKENKNGN